MTARLPPHTALLSGVCLALTGLLAFLLLAGGPAPRGGSSASSRGVAAVEPAPLPPALPPLASLAATLERPLFIATRRLAAATAATAGAGDPTIVLGRYRLSGVVIAERRRIVRLQPLAGGKAIELRVGSEIDGWRVVAIEPDHVELRSGRERQRIPLTPGGRR